MKIEHMENVRVVRHHTEAEAVIAGLGKHALNGVSNRILSLLHLERTDPAERELAEVLRSPLWREYEGEPVYDRTCALVSLEGDMGVHEFYEELAEKDYFPASVSEGMSYLPVLSANKIEVETVFHLGTATFVGEHNEKERRLLTRKQGSVELIPFYHATRLKPHYHIVVVRKAEKKKK